MTDPASAFPFRENPTSAMTIAVTGHPSTASGLRAAGTTETAVRNAPRTEMTRAGIWMKFGEETGDGGAWGDRTPDLETASLALSQLS